MVFYVSVKSPTIHGSYTLMSVRYYLFIYLNIHLSVCHYIFYRIATFLYNNLCNKTLYMNKFTDQAFRLCSTTLCLFWQQSMVVVFQIEGLGSAIAITGKRDFISNVSTTTTSHHVGHRLVCVLPSIKKNMVLYIINKLWYGFFSIKEKKPSIIGFFTNAKLSLSVP